MTAALVLGAVTLTSLVSCSAATGSSSVAQTSRQNERHSYIVEATSTDAAAQAVRSAGGEVVSRLGVIDAVEASLSTAEHALVLKAAGIKQITTNDKVITLAAASVKDSFEISSLANNDGSHRWYGDWIEQGDNNSPYDGRISIGWPDKNGKRLVLTGSSSIYRRAATPSSSPSVTLKFKSARFGLRAGEYVSVQASGNDGASWTEVGRIAGPATDGAFTNQSFNLTAYRGRNTAVRFSASMNGSFGTDHVSIDDVELAYTTNYGEGDPAPVDVNAQDLHAAGIRGRDVGVAVIDTGYWKIDSLDRDTAGNGRVAAQ
jgi:hypothetical protein